MSKIKFELIQPHIKCDGRSDITCYYRGKVLQEDEEKLICLIKVYGQDTLITFNKKENKVEDEEFQDLKRIL